MLSCKKLVGAAGVAALTLFAAGSASAVPVNLSTLVADFGHIVDGDFKANDFGNDLLTSGKFDFGAITYDNSSTNVNDRVLTTADKTVAQAQQAGGANGFSNAFYFNTSLSGKVGLSVSLQEFFPTSFSDIGFLDFRVTFVDVTGLGSSSAGVFSIDQTELNTASVISTQSFTDSVTGDANFNPVPVLGDQPFLKDLAGATNILAIVSGSAFVTPGEDNPSYTVTVTNVPLPAPLMLLVSALLGLGFLGRRRLGA